LRLPAPWDNVVKLTERFDGRVIARDADGAFRQVGSGIYDMVRGQ
jgi:hypothetical protein